jgi:hypothetical protein
MAQPIPAPKSSATNPIPIPAAASSTPPPTPHASPHENPFAKGSPRTSFSGVQSNLSKSGSPSLRSALKSTPLDRYFNDEKIEGNSLEERTQWFLKKNLKKCSKVFACSFEFRQLCEQMSHRLNMLSEKSESSLYFQLQRIVQTKLIQRQFWIEQIF